MEIQATARPLSKSPNQKVSAEELATLDDVCRGVMEKGGEQGAIAAKILEISERMRALSADIDGTLREVQSQA